jgi:Ser/Thr protein kinase RdoA (MazF antagonist)
MKQLAHQVAHRFIPEGRVTGVLEYGEGNINTTFLVSTDGRGQSAFILQRINTTVFRDPHLVMRNIRTATDHVIWRLTLQPLIDGRRWEVPTLIAANDGKECVVDDNGGIWRAMSYIDAQSFNTIQGVSHAREAGCAMGLFHWLLSDLPPDTLADTLKGFHVTPLYLEHFKRVMKRYDGEIVPEVRRCIDFVHDRTDMVSVLEDVVANGILRVRPIHGDPKVDNIMIDADTGLAVSIVDLDTVKPGLVHYDIGDCLRSCCNRSGETTDDLEHISFDTDICKAVLEGYVSYASEFLTNSDYSFIYEAVRLITFELGLRFLTDYLEGNVYFKVKEERHNLKRALVQFRLCESIERQESAIRNAVEVIR